MFLNFTNHPAAGWSAEQRRAALAYGVILDLPFPDVPPKCSTAEVAVLADAWAARILAMHPDCVLCQGEMTLTARVVQLLREHRVPVVAACSCRCAADWTMPPDAPIAGRNSALSASGNTLEPLKSRFVGGE